MSVSVLVVMMMVVTVSLLPGNMAGHHHGLTVLSVNLAAETGPEGSL